MNAPGDYVVRETRSVTPGAVTYVIVDRAGVVQHMTMSRAVSATEDRDVLLRARAASEPVPRRLT